MSKIDTLADNISIIENKYVTSRKERTSYGFYLLGQNFFYVICAVLLTNYATDLGINPIYLSIVLLIVKIWDAINDTIFGVLIDRFHLKGGKFIPWLKISLIGIPISTILLFSVPHQFPAWAQLLWIAICYLLWDTSYTICDIPIYGLPTAQTTNQQERIKIMANGRLFAGIGYNVAIALIPLINGFLRDTIGLALTWELTVILFSLCSFVLMIPICFHARERVTVQSTKPISFKEILHYMKTNKYLLIYYLSYIISGIFGISSVLTMYVGRYLTPLMDSYTLVSSVIAIPPFIILTILIPIFTKKYDKYSILVFGTILTIVISIISYFVGYNNVILFWTFTFLRSVGGIIVATVTFMFTADCAEYGYYKTGSNASGCAFATQTFSAKLNGTIVASLGLFVLGIIGFISGEPVEGIPVAQLPGFNDKLWFAFLIIPLIGGLLSLIPLYFYKLRDYKVEIMASYNQGNISKEESESLLLLSKKEYIKYLSEKVIKEENKNDSQTL